MTVFYTKGCNGSAAVLGGSKGTFGIDSFEYENNMRCGWKIQVEPDKVCDFYKDIQPQKKLMIITTNILLHHTRTH